MEPDKNIRSVEEHCKDLLREAEQYRLIQQVRHQKTASGQACYDSVDSVSSTWAAT